MTTRPIDEQFLLFSNMNLAQLGAVHLTDFSGRAEAW
jgi:hypothetical protein